MVILRMVYVGTRSHHVATLRRRCQPMIRGMPSDCGFGAVDEQVRVQSSHFHGAPKRGCACGTRLASERASTDRGGWLVDCQESIFQLDVRLMFTRSGGQDGDCGTLVGDPVIPRYQTQLDLVCRASGGVVVERRVQPPGNRAMRVSCRATCRGTRKPGPVRCATGAGPRTPTVVCGLAQPVVRTVNDII